MPLRTYPLRIMLASAGTSLLVLALAATLAVELNRYQGRTAEALGENIGSRRAAANLAETLNDMIALHRRDAREIEPLHERVSAHLEEIEQFADKEQERVYARQISDGFAAYLKDWRQTPAGPAASARLADRLDKEVAPLVVALREFNAKQIEESERVHRRSLRGMTWGLALVGGLGSLAGLVLGFGLSRGLRRTIHRVLIRVQGATELLSQELPAVELTRNTIDPPSDDAEGLVQQVEQVVQKLQQREREVRRAERLAAVGQLAAGVAHEIRNPLTSMKLLIQTSRRDPSAGGLSDEDLGMIEQEIQRLERSVQSFLDYARPPKLHRSPCDLAAVVRKTFGLARGRAEAQGVELRFHEPGGPLVIDADGEQVLQVLVNLTLNALDAMPRGGTLEIAVSARPPDAVEIAVSDTGPGVSPQLRPRLFEPFATGKETGLGLGLVVSRRIVEDHGGTIIEKGKPGGGACFAIRLPASAPAKSA